jgi:hypothetical protein
VPYLIGFGLSVGVAVLARIVGFDRDRAFYPAVLMVVASYYVLFAAMSQSMQTVLVESVLAAGFVGLAILGFKKSAWIVAAGLAGHGIFDAFHSVLLTNPGVPPWWPAFCGAFDVGAGAWLTWLLQRRAITPRG